MLLGGRSSQCCAVNAVTWLVGGGGRVADGGVRRRRLEADAARPAAALCQAQGQREEPQTL